MPGPELTVHQRRVLQTPGVATVGVDANGLPVAEKQERWSGVWKCWAVGRSGNPMPVKPPIAVWDETISKCDDPDSPLDFAQLVNAANLVQKAERLLEQLDDARYDAVLAMLETKKLDRADYIMCLARHLVELDEA